MNRQLTFRSFLLGILVGSAAAILLLLRPDPNAQLIVVSALVIGVCTGVANFRRGQGRAPFPDGLLLLFFVGLAAFWGWVLSTGYRGMVIEHWVDAAAAAIVIGIPVGGIALVVWNRASTGQQLFHDAAARRQDS